jgi:hypothetical protein
MGQLWGCSTTLPAVCWIFDMLKQTKKDFGGAAAQGC